MKGSKLWSTIDFDNLLHETISKSLRGFLWRAINSVGVEWLNQLLKKIKPVTDLHVGKKSRKFKMFLFYCKTIR